jgi:hypothetical protein
VLGHKYQTLLIALLLLLVAYPAFHGPLGSPVLAKTLLTVLFLAGGWVVFTERRLRVAGVVLGVPSLLGVWTGFVLPDRHHEAATIGFHLFAMVFLVFVLAVTLRGVHREKDVSVDTVAAALCGYLLLGIAFGHVYCVVELLLSGAFNGVPSNVSEHERHFLLTYYSLITLTTVGYGDITPARDTVRSLAMVEAVTGQFYLAVLVADLVGKRIAQALSPGSSPPD